jgi:hypothetical protein
MLERKVLCMALILVGCDAGEKHGGGHHPGGIEVVMGRAPRPSNHVESHTVAAPDASGTATQAKTEPKPDAAPTDAAPDNAAPTDAAPTDAAPAEGAPTEGAPTDAAPTEPVPVEPPPAEAAPPTPPPAGTDFAKLAKIRLSNPKIDEGIDPEVVKKRVRKGLDDLRVCYVSGLEKDAALAGKVELEFVVDKKGKIASSTVRSTTLADANVGTCMAKVVEAWKFEPAPADDVTVRYPFALATE